MASMPGQGEGLGDGEGDGASMAGAKGRAVGIWAPSVREIAGGGHVDIPTIARTKNTCRQRSCLPEAHLLRHGNVNPPPCAMYVPQRVSKNE